MLNSKIKLPGELAQISARLRRRGKAVVFTNGCFDILHYGHAWYLEEAKKKGDCLIVAVNSDASVRRIKGRKRPVMNQGYRASLVAALESVDYVTIFSEDTPIKIIKSIRPDILVKGSDWRKGDIAGADFVSSYGGRVETVRLAKGVSTTGIIKKIAQKFS